MVSIAELQQLLRDKEIEHFEQIKTLEAELKSNTTRPDGTEYSYASQVRANFSKRFAAENYDWTLDQRRINQQISDLLKSTVVITQSTTNNIIQSPLSDNVDIIPTTTNVNPPTENMKPVLLAVGLITAALIIK